MISEAPPTEYLLFFHSTVWEQGMTPEEVEGVMARLTVWFEDLDAKGLTDGGMRLSIEGRIVRNHNGRFVSDGPFVESKEAIAGYVHLRVRDMEEAVKIAQSWPGLAHGLTIEIRPVVPAC